jgi:hypothetical protein
MSLTDLAAFMNTNATEAASALGRAFAGGAGAADILRERGILQLIKDSQGIEDLTNLTLPEFRVALLQALTDPDGRIVGSADRLSKTFSGAVSNMQGSIEILSATIGDMFLPELTETVIMVDKFIQSIDTKEITEFALSLSIATTGLVIWRTQAILAALATLKFAKSFRALKFTAILLGISFIIDKALEWLGVFNDLSDQTKDNIKALEDAKKTQDAYIESLKHSTVAVEELNEEEQKYTENLQKKVDRLLVELVTLEGADARTIAFFESKKLLTAQDLKLIDRAEELTKAINEEKEAIERAKKASEELNRIKERSIEVDSQIIASKRLISIVESSLEKNTLSALESTDASIKKEQLRLQTLEDLRTELNLQGPIFEDLIENFDLANAGATTHANKVKLANNIIVQLDETEANLAIKIIENAQATQLYTDKMNEHTNALERTKSQKKELTAIEENFMSIFNQTDEGQKRNIESTIKAIEENKNLISSIEGIGEVEVDIVLDQLNTDLENITETTNELGKQGAMAAGIILNLASSFKQLTDAETDAAEANAIMMRSLGQILMMIPGGQIPGAMMMAGSMFVGHTGGLIKQTGIQKFATGGMVHGQDNVPIMAQAGEFIMQRSAVQNIGVNNLANMNETGNTPGNVTVNISGNMIGNDEFVRDNLIPQIQKASKQNLA